MSDRPKFPRAKAVRVAGDICTAFKPHCENLIVAGSLRRGRALVGDVEILYVPRIESRKDGLFDIDTTCFNPIDELLEKWLFDGWITKRPNVHGNFAWGPQNKLGVHVASGIPVDFFSTTAEKWWVSLVIRTGGKAMNLKLTNGAIKLGRSLMAYGCGVRYPDGNVAQCFSEEDVFFHCDIPFIPPQLRR